MAEKEKFVDNVSFLYRTMVERDPSKRRVKPVEKHLQLLDFADLDDSSDDSDFQIGDHEQEESDDQGDTSDDEDDGGNATILSEDDEAEEEEEEVVETKVKIEGSPDSKSKVPKLVVGDLIERAMQRQNQAKQRITSGGSTSGSYKRIRILICCICLGDISIEDDEIVECDSCGVSVHEGCYGISDSDSVMSTVSSSSTEPWFCDPCKAGVKNPVCELCPSTCGIFKETDVGKWVHLVCALYIPGVAFGDVDKLTPVTLFEMPYSRWGAKACSLCEDERLSRTGVCIACDAGMCKAFFHVTCAQREGLLSEAQTGEEIADPFFAHCKVHADKMIVRSKRRNWLALQSQRKEKVLEVNNMDPKEKARVERKLNWHKQKYNAAKATRPQPWVPTQKMPRLLTSCPSACKKLIKKAEILGMSPQTHMPSENMMDIRRKWHVPPAFNVEFVSYYLDRNCRMVTMQRRLDELQQQNSQLQEQEVNLRSRYEEITSELEELKKENSRLQDVGLQYWKILCDVGPKKFPLPEVLKAKKSPSKSPNRTNRRYDSSSSVIVECGICHKSHDQHQLAKCDNCQLHYHLSCLDPPLTRMPKKNKSMGWQCSECDKNPEEEREKNLDPNAPRRLRDHVKGTSRFDDSPILIKDESRKSSRLTKRTRNYSPSESFGRDDQMSTGDDTLLQTLSSSEKRASGSPSKKRRKPLRPYTKPRRGKRRKTTDSQSSVEKTEIAEILDVSSSPVVAAKPAKIAAPKKEPKIECCRCNEAGDSNNSVTCDQCKKGYHFLCLNPPVKKSPKQRGYTWHCEDCNTSEEEEVDQDKGKEKEEVKAEEKET